MLLESTVYIVAFPFGVSLLFVTQRKTAA